MTQLSFAATGAWDTARGFGCASLGLACNGDKEELLVQNYPVSLAGTVFTGTYSAILAAVEDFSDKDSVHAGILLFGNAGGENRFLGELQRLISCPIVGGGAAIDGPTGRKGLITGGGEAALLLITDDRYTYEAKTQCIHDRILGSCTLELEDARTVKTINGMDGVAFWREQQRIYGLKDTDFEHMTLSDLDNVNAHLSIADGKLRSGRDLTETMLLRCVEQETVYPAMHAFYDDPEAIVFGCAGLSGLLDRPLHTDSLGLFLFGEVCYTAGKAEFGNLMLSKLVIKPR